jgi:hypothetical protein
MEKEITQDLRSYRFIGEEAESLGRRLDSARLALESAQSPWAKRYWTMVIDQLLFQWRSLPALHDGAASMSIIPRWSVDYEFFEIDHSPSAYNITDKIFDEILTDLDLGTEFLIKTNNRKILDGLLAIVGIKDDVQLF